MLAVIRAHRRIRPRGLVALTVALSAAFTVAAAPSAPANELGDRQRRVHHQIGQAEEELRQSSQALLQATTRVRQAQDRLDAAQSVLRTRRAQLAAAELLDAETQSELDDATARLQRAKTALAQGRRSQDAQQQQLRRAAAETYQSGSPQLLGLTMVLTSHDPTQLSSQLNVVQNVMDRESATLQRLEASRLLLQLQERHVQQARDEVAARRRAAAAALARTQTLEVRAAVANDRVSQLLAERTKAQAQAARAKRADEQRLNQLVRERDRIESLILRQEAEMRRRESRAAIMRAKRRSYSPGSGLTYPVQAPITSPYGMRLHPVYHRWTLHDDRLRRRLRDAHPRRGARAGDRPLLQHRLRQPRHHRPRLHPRRVGRDRLQPPEPLCQLRRRVGTTRAGDRLRRHDGLLDRLPPPLHGVRQRAHGEPHDLAALSRHRHRRRHRPRAAIAPSRAATATGHGPPAGWRCGRAGDLGLCRIRASQAVLGAGGAP